MEFTKTYYWSAMPYSGLFYITRRVLKVDILGALTRSRHSHDHNKYSLSFSEKKRLNVYKDCKHEL